MTWASADSPPVELEVPAPYDTPARVNGIDEDGTVAGGLFRNGFYVPVVWASDGRFQALTVPRGDGVFPNLTADGIRNDGRTIAGEVPNDQSGSTAYVWTCR
nr:hypothetical protein GCM10020063_094220 [Dactylosporangium thailandense]